MKDLIEQLQQNERPFGLMSEEMQAKAKGISGDNFDYVGISGDWGQAFSVVFCKHQTYRLRADYTEQVEDEYELCEIDGNGDSGLFYKYRKSEESLAEAPNDPNFAGYLYEDGRTAAYPVMFKDKTRGSNLYSEYSGDKQTCTPIRPTHVVFKK